MFAVEGDDAEQGRAVVAEVQQDKHMLIAVILAAVLKGIVPRRKMADADGLKMGRVKFDVGVVGVKEGLHQTGHVAVHEGVILINRVGVFVEQHRGTLRFEVEVAFLVFGKRPPRRIPCEAAAVIKGIKIGRIGQLLALSIR